MKKAICGIFVATQLMGAGFAVAQTNTNSAPGVSPLTGSPQLGPVLAVSPSALNFGLVGVGRTKQLTFTVQNVGSGILNGTATVAAPFNLFGNAYWLQKSQSQSVSVRYMPTAEGTNSESVVFPGANAATVAVTGFARTPPRAPGKPRVVSKPSTQFTEEEDADFIARYYSDETSYALKPAVMDGVFRSISDRAFLLKLAGQQPRHDLAVIVLIHYPGEREENSTKLAWLKDLKGLGYQRIVFLRGGNSMKVNGLPILEYPQAPTMTTGK